MSQVVSAANAKRAALWNCVGQWHNVAGQIRSPQDVYQESRLALRNRVKQEIHQHVEGMVHPDHYERAIDKIIDLGGDIKELDNQYTLGAQAMEDEYQERLAAVNQSFAYNIIGVFGDTLDHPPIQDQMRLRLALASQESTVDTNTAGGDVNTEPDAHPDPEVDSVPGLNAAPESATTGDRTPEVNPSSGETEVPLPREDLTHQSAEETLTPGIPIPNVPAPDIPAPGVPVPDVPTPSVSAPEVPASDVPILETSPAQQATEMNPASEADLSLEINGVSAKNEALGASLVPQTNPASDANPVPAMNPAPALSPGSGTSIARHETSQQSKETHGPNLPMSLRASSREHRAANSPSQLEGSQNDVSSTGTGSNSRLSSDPPAANRRLTRKRHPARTIDQQQKRPRYDTTSVLTGDRVIEFDQVFQDGNALVKYTIEQFPINTGEWYIFECKQHHKHFVNNPIKGAAKHLAGRGHRLSKEHEVAVMTLGTHVLNCNAALAKKNNQVAKDAFARQLGLPPMSTRSNRRTQQSPATGTESDGPLHNHGGQNGSQASTGAPIPQGILSPVAGEIYACTYPRTVHIYPVLVLPWKSFDHFKWKEDLLRDTPPCYLHTDEFPRGWAEGYKDGGPLVSQREYPVIYFDAERFPEDCNVGWASVSWFRTFDLNDTNIVHRKSVAEFLQNKDSRFTAGANAFPKQICVISDESDNDDPVTDTGVKRENSEGRSARNTRVSDKNDENTAIGERGGNVSGGSGRSINRDGQSKGHQAQAEQNSHNETRDSGNDSVFNHNPILREDIDQGAASLSGTHLQSLAGDVLQQHLPSTLSSACEWRMESTLVFDGLPGTGEASFQPQASLGDSSSNLPTTGIEGQRPGAF